MKAHTAPHLALFSILFLCFASTISPGGCALEISSADEFIDFANNVNSGANNYEGETVYLTADIDMTDYSSQFEPVGKSNDNSTFSGTFDGQGHTISNLVISSDAFRFLGVFGVFVGSNNQEHCYGQIVHIQEQPLWWRL